MNSAQEPIILFADEIRAFPRHQRAVARYLANTGRAIIKENSRKSEKTA